MTSILVAASILALIPAILLKPHVGILMWFWVGIMNPHRWAWGSLEVLGYAQIIALATLAAWVFSREPKRFPVTAVTGLLIVFAVWVTLTSVTARVPDAAWQDWNLAIKILVMTFVSIALITTRERLHALIWIAVLSLGYWGFKGGLFTLLTGGAHRVWGPENSFIASNNQLAMALIMTLPLMMYLRSQSANAWLRAALLMLTVVCVFSIIGSQSRGAFLAISVMAAFLIVRARQRVALGIGVMLVAVSAVFFVPESWVERMESIADYEEDGSAQGRLLLWTFAVKTAVDNPIVGGGFNVFYDTEYFFRLMPEAGSPRSFHSVYFEVLGEHGFIGLALFLGLFAVTWLTLGRVIRRSRGRPDLAWAHELGRMVQVSLVGYASAGAFLNLAFYDLYYLLLSIAVVTDQIVRAQTAAHGQPRRTRAAVPAARDPAAVVPGSARGSASHPSDGTAPGVTPALKLTNGPA